MWSVFLLERQSLHYSEESSSIFVIGDIDAAFWRSRVIEQKFALQALGLLVILPHKINYPGVDWHHAIFACIGFHSAGYVEFILGKRNMAAPVFFFFFDDVVGEFKSMGKVLVYQFIFEGIIQHKVEHGFNPGFCTGKGVGLLPCVLASVLNDVAVLHDALDMPCTKVFDTHTIENMAVPPGGGYCPCRRLFMLERKAFWLGICVNGYFG